MIYSKKQIEQYSYETGFIKNCIEKVVRLIDVLKYLFTESSFKDKLVLKGGTAINLVHTNLQRLSVDIDLDYIGSLEKETLIKDRKILEEELDQYMTKENYEISNKSRDHYALLSRIYKFKNAFNGNDTIKVDINFMDRVHLYETQKSRVTYFEKTVTLITPRIEELFGMKVNALIDRSKPRDLYDTMFLVNNLDLVDKNMFRKAVIFYLSLNNIFELNESSFARIDTITQYKTRTELFPVLNKKEKFDIEEAKEKVIKSLTNLLILSNKEKEYLSEFSKGNYDPSLLFDGDVLDRISNHPMAKWRALNLDK